jgi:hypothetical protein
MIGKWNGLDNYFYSYLQRCIGHSQLTTWDSTISYSNPATEATCRKIWFDIEDITITQIKRGMRQAYE